MKIHFIGIGGIGVSALAQYYLAKGHQISGSDLVSSEITDSLKKHGVKLTRKEIVKSDLVIYSPAVPENNPDLKKAKKLGIKCLSYPQALGELTKRHFTIAVSGTHGKSTTTAMLGLLLTKAGFDPTVIVGTKVKEFGDSNFRAGKPVRQAQGKIQYLVIEADEHFASFLNYWPKIIVLTNIEADHLDYYKNIKNVREAFKEFISHLPKDGVLINHQSVKQKDAQKLRQILKVPGEHNVYDANLALTVARRLKIPDSISFQALSEFRGTWRRFEISQKTLNKKQITVVSDYGHHPTEVRVTLKAAREKWPKKEIWCVFQPHQYQRTYYLFKDFVKVFESALRPAQGKPLVDKLIITDIFDVAGREEKEIKKKVSAQKLVEAINKPSVIYPHHQKFGVGVYLPKSQIIDYLKKSLRGREVLIIMGAGDIYKIDKDLE